MNTIPVTDVTVGQKVYVSDSMNPKDDPSTVTNTRRMGDRVYLTFDDGVTIGYPVSSMYGVTKVVLG